MVEYSEMIVFFWLLPVLLQIILPLFLLTGAVVIKFFKILIAGKERLPIATNGDLLERQLQPSR